MTPRIVILEPENYPPRAFEILRLVGEVELNDGKQNLGKLLSPATVLVLRLKFFVTREFLDQAPNVKVIATATTGLDHIDLATAAARGVAVLSLRGETAFLQTVTATAEHTWGLLLSLLRYIPEAHQSVINGQWDRSRFFGRELQGRTLGIVGLGRIGQMVARYGLAFRMKVIAHDPFQSEWIENVQRAANLDEVVAASDVLSIHVPLSEETKHLIGARQFASAKPGCIIVNTSRGSVLDEQSLLDALEQGHLGGAALDVIQNEYESVALRDRLIKYAATHRNLLITPHLGGATTDSLEKVEIFMAEKLARFLKGGA